MIQMVETVCQKIRTDDPVRRALKLQRVDARILLLLAYLNWDFPVESAKNSEIALK